MEETFAKKKLNLAFAGVGWIGLTRLQSIIEKSNAKVSIIFDPSPEALKKISEVVPTAKVVDTFEDLLSEQDIDGVVIATPNFLHHSQTIAALNVDIPVLCQKPLTKNSYETFEILNTAREKNKSVTVDYSYRSTNAFGALIHSIKNGNIGEIYSVELIFHNAYGPEKEWCYNYELSGGGCLLDLGVHLIDLSLIALDYPIVEVLNSVMYSKGKRILPHEKIVEDYAKALLKTENDCLIDVCCSWNLNIGKGAEIKVLFNGSNGAAQFSNINGSFYDFRADLFKGDKSYELFSGYDDWGSRLTLEWISKISEDNSFDDKSLKYLNTAEAIDKIYGR